MTLFNLIDRVEGASGVTELLRVAGLFEPALCFDAIGLDQANEALVRWGHKMGPLNRPTPTLAHGLFHNGRLVGMAAADHLMAEKCGGFSRAQAVELSRVCAEREHLCRAVLRLWREFVLPEIMAARGVIAAISYQDAVLHSGDLYRFDGWERLNFSHSGKDTRSGRPGRDKWIWAYPKGSALRALEQERPRP